MEQGFNEYSRSGEGAWGAFTYTMLFMHTQIRENHVVN